MELKSLEGDDYGKYEYPSWTKVVLYFTPESKLFCFTLFVLTSALFVLTFVFGVKSKGKS